MTAYLLRIPLSHKLLISSLAFCVPVGILLYFVVSQSAADIEFGRVELDGIRASRPLQDILERVASRNTAEATEIDAGFRRLQAYPGGLDAERIAAARTAWENVRGRMDDGDARGQLLRAIQALLKRLGDVSNLTIDPRLDSFYLVNLALVDLPEELVLLDAAADGDAATVAIELGVVAERVREDGATALREDARFESLSPSLQAKLPPLLQAHQAAVGAFIDRARRGEPAAVELASARNAALALWREGSVELETLVRSRVDGHKRRRFSVLAVSLGGLVLALLLVLSIARAVTRRLDLVTRIACQIASGRLDLAQASLDGPEARRLLNRTGVAEESVADESWRLFRAFGAMTGSLRSLLDQVRQSGVQVGGSVTAMASAVKQLEATVAEQAASTTEVAATNKEIFGSVRALARTMQTVGGMAAEAAALAGEGMNDLGRIRATMDALLQATAALSEILTRVGEQSARITDVITVITKVANRTNLLSLNAAIEAEKAGQSAAGFSVVAAEVRRLADQTAISALEIERSIEEMRGAVNEGIRGVGEYGETVRGSSASMAAITASLGRLLEQTRLLGPHFDSVNEGVQGQAQGAGQIMEAMQQLDEGASHTKEAIAELQQVALQMKSAVQGLQAGVARFSTAS